MNKFKYINQRKKEILDNLEPPVFTCVEIRSIISNCSINNNTFIDETLMELYNTVENFSENKQFVVKMVSYKNKQKTYDGSNYVENDITRNFNNQISFSLRFANDSDNHGFYCNKNGTERKFNIKLFKKGSVTLTGCKHKQEILDILLLLCQIIERYLKLTNKIEYSNLRKSNIFGNFKSNQQINQTKCNEILIEKYNLVSVFDPHYCGIRVKFMLNEKRDGVCVCPVSNIKFNHVKRKFIKIKKSQCKCKIVTVSIFGSGSVSITSCTKKKELNIVSEFFKDFIKNHYKDIYSFDTKKILIELKKQKNTDSQ